jgi:hypothetical protein
LIATQPAFNGGWFIEQTKKCDVDSAEVIDPSGLRRPISVAKTPF